MSVITANNSLLDYEARKKSYSRQMRNYQKVSQSNLDHASIISYLKSRNLTKTLTTFLLESNSKKTVQPLMDVFLKGAKDYEGSVEQYWEAIKNMICKKNENFTAKEAQERKAKAIKLELFIHIWYCISDNELNPQRLSTLKQFIQSKGQILSELPQLLSYFALPYADKRIGNPILKRIFSKQWREQVKILLEELIGAESDSMEQEWFNIIVDMIEICDELIKNISFEHTSHHLRAMVERVTLYKTVVDKNQMDHKNQLSKLTEVVPEKSKELSMNMNNEKEIKGMIFKLNENLVQNKNGEQLVLNSPNLQQITRLNYEQNCDRHRQAQYRGK